MTIDYEIQNLLPALSEEQLELLEEDIKKNGCLNPIIVWKDTIVDGHNRYGICKKNKIPFKTKEMQFENKQEAMIWAWTTQKARRNIDDGTLFNIAKVFKPYYEKKAKENQIKAAENTNAVFIKCEKPSKEKQNIEPVNTTKELANMAGTSQSTMNKVIQIQKKAPDILNKAVNDNLISINKGYEITKKIKDLPKEKQQYEAERLIKEQFDKECKEIDKKAKIYSKFVDAVYKPISVEITEENVSYWLEEKTREQIDYEEKNISEAINNLCKLRELLKKYKVIRVVK